MVRGQSTENSPCAYVVSKLNKKYDLNLIRKNITGSDFIVELDANSVSGLM